MKHIIAISVLWVLSSCAILGQVNGSQETITIIVADRPLAGSFSVPQQRGNRMFLPVAGIARALGDAVTLDPIARSVEVRRQTGVTADFSAQTNQVRENGSIIVVVPNTVDIVFPPNPEELMLPVEIVAPLLDISIIAEQGGRVVRITRGQVADAVQAGAKHAPWELYQADYIANLNVYSSSFNHNFTAHSSGRILDGRFDFLSNLDGGTGQKPLMLRRSSFALDRENGQRLILGDFGSGTQVEFLSSAIRGLWLQQPFDGLRVTAFGGRAMSGVPPPVVTPVGPITGLPQAPVQRFQPRYDTNVLGSYASFGPSVNKSSGPRSLLFSSGFMYFNGPTSSGGLAAGSVRYNSRRTQFQGDAGVGNFSGMTLHGSQVDGVAPMIDASELFKVTDSFTLRGRYTHIGSNFLSPQSSGLFAPMDLISGGFNWRLTQWLSASLTGTSRTQLDLPGPLTVQSTQTDHSVTATLSVTPRGFWPTMNFTHTQGNNSLTGNNAYTLFNATKEFKNWRLFGNFTRIQNGQFLRLPGEGLPVVTPASTNVTAGAMVRVNDSNSIQLSQSVGSGESFGGAFDWMTSSFFTKRVTFGAGFGYDVSQSRVTLVERALATIELPRRQTLQISYINTPSGVQVVAQLRGILLESRRAEAAKYAPIADIRSFGALSGKVYQDINLNGKFDPGIDKPQEGVQVRVDGNFYEVTDRDGNFRVENVKAGEHVIYMDLLSVRADLTLLSGAQHAVILKAGRDLVVDFRLVRTGRIKGLVWMDLNGNGKFDEGEQALADVRVFTGSGHDTLTDAQGEFVLGDLPPGEHVVLVDEKTLPENSRSGGSLSITVQAGVETGNVNFPVVAKQAEVNIKQFLPSQQKP